MGNNDLTYAKSSTGGSWVIENTPGLIGDPAFTKICVNNAGDVFISYFNFANHNLRVAMKMGGKWKNELVARGDYVGLPHSPAVNGSLPMIAFYDSDTKDLKLASYDPNLGVEPGNPTDKSAGGAKGRSFALYQNAPNPVTGATTFTFELAEASTVELAIYDTAGRKVARVADGHFGPGEHDVSFTRALTPGVYVYRLDVGSESAARKMVVVK
jgi:hypothetical protein